MRATRRADNVGIWIESSLKLDARTILWNTHYVEGAMDLDVCECSLWCFTIQHTRSPDGTIRVQKKSTTITGSDLLHRQLGGRCHRGWLNATVRVSSSVLPQPIRTPRPEPALIRDGDPMNPSCRSALDSTGDSNRVGHMYVVFVAETELSMGI